LRLAHADAPAAAEEPCGGGEDPQPQPFGFPAAGRSVQGEHLRLGRQFAGQCHDLVPDLVLGVAVEGEVGQAGVLSAADPVLAPGPAPMAEFEVGELPATRAGGKAGEPVPADVGEAQLHGGMATFLSA